MNDIKGARIMLQTAKKRKNRKQEQIKTVSEEIRQIAEAIEASDAGFNEVEDSDLLEAIIYERSSLRARYSYLIKELKRIEAE